MGYGIFEIPTHLKCLINEHEKQKILLWLNFHCKVVRRQYLIQFCVKGFLYIIDRFNIASNPKNIVANWGLKFGKIPFLTFLNENA